MSGLLRAGRNAAAKPPGAITFRPARSAPVGCLVAFFMVFLLAGLAAFFFVFIKPVSQVLAARSWVAVPCHILRSDVQSHRGSKGGTTYSVHIVYQYEFEERRHESSRYQFMTGSSSGYDGKAAVVRRYPPGSQSTCYVNPTEPAEAVIQREFTPGLLLGLLPLLFVAVGLGGVWAAATGKFAPRPGAPGRITGAAKNAASSWKPASVSAAGPASLKPKTSRTAMLLVAVMLAAFWNGIISVFVWQAVKAWRNGSPEWFLMVFLIPFVLVGLALIGFVGYSFLQLFNPQVTLTASSALVPLGGTLDLGWRISGQVARLDRFTITLEGREEVTYRRGTKTSTDKHVFARIELFSTSSRPDMRAGRVQVTVPVDSMHSFETDNNKILWSMVVKGSIPRWPDLAEEFPLTVLPQPVATALPA